MLYIINLLLFFIILIDGYSKIYRYQVGDNMEMKHRTDCKILVVGDIMLDKYVVGEVIRISPEAPVPVVNVTTEFSTLGGCGNVVANLIELGVSVSCCSIIGTDEAGKIIIDKLDNLGCEMLFIAHHTEKITPIKERIVANHRLTQLLRIDRENHIQLNPIGLVTTEDISNSNYDIIIISDYNKGTITEELVTILKKTKIPIIVDPKVDNIQLYNDTYMITPNNREYDEIIERNNEFNNEFILKTLGKDGMQLIYNGHILDIPSTPVDVYNVSGAGDTVIAIVSTCISMGIAPLTSAKIANDCARYVVQKAGPTIVPKNIFMEILNQYALG